MSSELQNPQSLNSYSYVTNNPLRYVDENGEYGSDVHYDLQYFLGAQSGLDITDAYEIAIANQGTDDDPETGPWVSYEARANYHFVNKEKLNNLYLNATESMNNKDIGQYFHAMQDSKYSHDTFKPLIGHILFGHEPDKTYKDVRRANAMAKETFYTLRIFNALKNGTDDFTTEMYNRQTEGIWDTIKDKIHNFNSAKNYDDKIKALYPELYKKEDKTDKK